MFLLIFLIVLIPSFFFLFKNQKKALTFAFIILILVSSLRKYTVGVDTAMYYRSFTSIINSSSLDYTNFRYEPGFFYLCKFIGLFSDDPQILIVTTAIIINLSVYFFIRLNSENYLMSTLIFVFYNSFFSGMNTMREWLAISFILIGFSFLVRKKLFLYILFNILALMFHNSAWAGFLILGIYYFGNKKLTYFIIVFIGLILFVRYDAFYNSISKFFGYDNYTEKFTVSNYFGALLVFAEGLIIFLLSFLGCKVNFSNKNILKNKTMGIYAGVGFLYLFFLLMVMRVNLFNRIAGVFEVFLCLIIPKFLTEIKRKNLKDYYAYFIGIVGVMVICFVIINLARPEWLGVLPYEFFWSN